MALQIPTELRHGYRALLRAATYLPDSSARSYIHDYVVYRFRSTANKTKSKNGDPIEELIAKFHAQKRIGKVWQAARQLERAGQGGIVELKKVLYLTYGRAGKRRRELIHQLLLPDEHLLPEDDEALEELIKRPSEKGAQRADPASKLRSFIRSQQVNHPAESIRPKIRKLTLQIPKENIWGRPVPLKLQASMKKQWWADTLDKLLPPVPVYEWNRLRDFATGATPIEEPPPRRSKPREEEVAEQDDAKLWDYFTIHARLHDSEIEEIEVESDHISTSWRTCQSTKDIRNARARSSITPRFMRRLYANIWCMTPTMSQDEVTKTWTIKWGTARSAAHSGQITSPSVRDLELFEGADETVMPPSQSKPQRPGSKKPLQAVGLKASVQHKEDTGGLLISR